MNRVSRSTSNEAFARSLANKSSPEGPLGEIFGNFVGTLLSKVMKMKERKEEGKRDGEFAYVAIFCFILLICFSHVSAIKPFW
jgi:hypothetical protein